MNMNKRFIKNLLLGETFMLVPNTVYRVTNVYTANGQTSVTYTVEGSSFRGETTFTRASLTTVEVV